jgi:hypothetical protein
MHLQQTKRVSRETGGPQYYFHDLTRPVKTYLRTLGVVPVALMTPYGATATTFAAVDKGHKLDSRGRAVPGRVGHDRIQQGSGSTSIGEAIRHWYRLPGGDFERIDVDIEFRDEAFYLTPLGCQYTGGPHKQIRRTDRPLTFTVDYISPLWRDQIRRIHKEDRRLLPWAREEVCRIIQDHKPPGRLAHILEADLLRASGPLQRLGLSLGGYVGKGYDCMSSFSFLDYPPYEAPVELKKHSRDFRYQERKYGRDLLSRAVVLCAVHDHRNLHRHIDVIELDALCRETHRFLAT